MIYSVKTLELSLKECSMKLKELISKARGNSKHSCHKTEFGFVDESLANSGIVVEYHCGNKRKIKLIVNPSMLFGYDGLSEFWNPKNKNVSKLLQKLDDIIESYFDYEYGLNDFKLCEVCVSANVKLDERELVHAYISVFNNIGRVKGFKPKFTKVDNSRNKSIRFDLKGNSNGVEFSAFDLAAMSKLAGIKGMHERVREILAFDVRLTTQSAIRNYAN